MHGRRRKEPGREEVDVRRASNACSAAVDEGAKPPTHGGEKEEGVEEGRHDRAAPDTPENGRVVLDHVEHAREGAQSTRLLPANRRNTSSRVLRLTSELSGRKPR